MFNRKKKNHKKYIRLSKIRVPDLDQKLEFFVVDIEKMDEEQRKLYEQNVKWMNEFLGTI